MNRFALLSVSDKTNIGNLAAFLQEMKYTILSTGGTLKELRERGIRDVVSVEEYTGLPEMFGGRVKTLHPKLFAGLLARPEDMAQLNELKWDPIDVLAVNFYPFAKVLDDPDTTFDELIENIDIGGPALVRAAAKNYQRVTVLHNPATYDVFIKEARASRAGKALRYSFARTAYRRTFEYDAAIAGGLPPQLPKD